MDNCATVSKKFKSHMGQRRADGSSAAGPVGKMLSWVAALRIILGLFLFLCPTSSIYKLHQHPRMQNNTYWASAFIRWMCKNQNSGFQLWKAQSLQELAFEKCSALPHFLLIGLGIPVLSVLAAVNLTLLQIEISFANSALRDRFWAWVCCMLHVMKLKFFHLSKT